MPRRTRRRWLIAGGVAAGWTLLLYLTGSLVAGTALLLFLAAIGVLGVLGLRALGIGRSHPWVQQARSRPWRDGQEVLQLALRHLPEVFVITPGGSLLAPNAVELWLHPDDLSSLCEVMDIDLVNASAAEVYAEQVAAHGARFARPGAPEVWVTGEPSVPRGRYRLRQARPVDAEPGWQPGLQLVPSGAPAAAAAVPPGVPVPPHDDARPLPRRAPRAPAGAWPFAQDGLTRGESAQAATAGPSLPTVAEKRGAPVLRLVTGDSVTQTQQSGARAGRGHVELALPEVMTVSREHARFTYSGGQWWIENLGRNGVTINGARLEGQRPVRGGDEIRWGAAADAPVSRVEIG
ncbi:MAG: FHA domain-containing protein [Gemmatimonadota bacterium]